MVLAELAQGPLEKHRLNRARNRIVIIHYACSDFTKSPVEISCIGIKEFVTKKTHTFSRTEYKTDKELLSKFYDYVDRNSEKIYVGWNFKTTTYGPQALERRYKELFGNAPPKIREPVDLDEVIKDTYGRNYVEDGRYGKLWSLMVLNGIQMDYFRGGEEEVELYEKGEFIEIENSTNCKVQGIANIMDIFLKSKLRTRIGVPKTIRRKPKAFASKKVRKSLARGYAMKDKLEVFISSAQGEFEKERTTLAQRISKMPFLVCNPLEKRGAESVSAIEASLQGVRDCDIYIGIFGSRYSETTKAEFREALKHYKMCLNYAKRVKSREKQLQEFLEAELKPQFKYHQFSKSKDLYEQIEEDLNRHLLRLLRLGLDNFKSKKRRAIETGRTEQQQIRTAILRKEEDRPLAMVMAARSAYSSEDYLTAVIKATVAVELALRFALLRMGISGRELRRPFGHLLQFALRTEVFSKQDLTYAKDLRYVRNAALHDGRTPLKKEALVAIKLAENLIKKLRE